MHGLIESYVGEIYEGTLTATSEVELFPSATTRVGSRDAVQITNKDGTNSVIVHNLTGKVTSGKYKYVIGPGTTFEIPYPFLDTFVCAKAGTAAIEAQQLTYT